MAYFTLKNSIKLIIVVAIIAFTSFQTYLCMAQTPAQPYRKIKQLGEVEIRFYPPAIEASVYKKGEYRQMMSNGFRDLAGYIFGGNEEKQKIAMTTPVKSVVDAPKADSGMITFVMPTDFKMENKPTPFAKNIIFHETKATYTASLTFGGFASRTKMERKSDLLLEMLKKEGVTTEGKVSFLYYNPPFQLFGRRNEVLVQITNFSE
jgi:hypothetical protein